MLRACDERARGSPAEVAQARIGYAESRRQVEVFNSEGRAAADDRTRVRLSVQVVARRDDRVETGSDNARRPRRLGAGRPPTPSRWPRRPRAGR